MASDDASYATTLNPIMSKQMHAATPFSRLDTVIVRVRSLSDSLRWYEEILGTKAGFVDDTEALAVLPTGDSGSITLWQLKPGENAAGQPGRAGTFPIFAVEDAEGAHAFVTERGGVVDALESGEGVRFFGFRDPDGNYLEACQVL